MRDREVTKAGDIVTAGGVALPPHSAAARLAERFPNPPRVERHETTDEARERAQAALAARQRVWRAPSKFVDALFASLALDEDPDGKVSRWLDSRAQNLILWSPTTGNGKSYAAHAIGNEAILRGITAASWTMTRLNQAFRPGNDPTAFDVACTVDLLVIDDLGGETTTEWTHERLLDVIDARNGSKRTIVTTNLTGEALVARYDGRIVERMVDGAWIVEFTGPSRRKPAPW